MSKYINNIIAQGEHQLLDFKFEVNDVRKIAITLVAFANTNGGKLLIGVKDNGKITGIRSEEEFYMLDSAAGIFCKPSIDLSYKKWPIEGKTILEVDIPEGNDKPYYCKTTDGRWRAYFRQKDENHLANIVHLTVWKNKKSTKGILLKYSEKEQFLLNYLKKNNHININQFARLTKINRRKSISIISKLICFELLEMVYTEEKYLYQLKQY